MRWARTSPAEIVRAREALTDLVTASLEEALELVSSTEREGRHADLLAFIEGAAEAARSLRRLDP